MPRTSGQSPIGRLHVLTDFTFQQKLTHAQLAEMAIQGGADVIQFRQKTGSIRDILANAKAVAAVCRNSGTTLLINDRVDVAMAVGADGVHLGQNDFPLRDARMVLGSDALIGLTASSVSEALAAEQGGVDYIGFGPVYPTRSKSNPASVKGLEGILEVANAIRLPIIGIAGISAGRCADVLRAGAHGVAVMTAISCADDPVGATRQLAGAIEGVTRHA